MTAPSSDSLVVEAADAEVEPLDSGEGAGVLSGVADAVDAWGSGDPLQIAARTAGAGLDLLGVVASPLDDLAAAGIGWLIEHIRWLHEPLDALAGDPAQIAAQAQTWHAVAEQLGAVAGAYRSDVSGGVAGWEGGASDAYRAAVGEFAGRLDEVAGRADRIASVLLVTGEAVGTVRGRIRDAIAEFVWLVVQLVFWAGVLAFLTVGGSLAAGAVRIVERALDLATDHARRVSELLDVLSAAGGTTGRLADAVRDTAQHARASVPVVRGAADDVVTAAENAHVDDAVDVATTLTNAAQEHRGWSGPSA